MKKLAVGIWLLSSVLAVQAAPLAVQPRAGQWQINTQTFAEGKDIGPQMQFIKQQAAAFLNPKQLEKLNQYDPSEFNECLTPKQAALLADPQKSLDFLSQALGQCQLELTGQDSHNLHFSGYCSVPKHGIDGQVKGSVNYQSPTQVQGTIEGTGSLPSAVQLLLLGRMQPQMHVRNQFSALWQQATCKPL